MTEICKVPDCEKEADFTVSNDNGAFPICAECMRELVTGLLAIGAMESITVRFEDDNE